MTHTYTDLLRSVRSPWLRCQGAISALYFQRVTLPQQLWRACGRPPQFRPSVPWWQPFVWRWLVLSGWLRPARRRQRSV